MDARNFLKNGVIYDACTRKDAKILLKYNILALCKTWKKSTKNRLEF